MLILNVNPYDYTYPSMNNITNTSSLTVLYFTSKDDFRIRAAYFISTINFIF